MTTKVLEVSQTISKQPAVPLTTVTQKFNLPGRGRKGKMDQLKSRVIQRGTKEARTTSEERLQATQEDKKS